MAVGVALKAGTGDGGHRAIMKGFQGMPAGFLASMAHDILAGKPIEVDHLSGVVVKLGSQTGVPTPAHKFITQALAPFAAGKPVV